MSLGDPEDFSVLEEVGMRVAGAFLAVFVVWKASVFAAAFLLDLLPV